MGRMVTNGRRSRASTDGSKSWATCTCADGLHFLGSSGKVARALQMEVELRRAYQFERDEGRNSLCETRYKVEIFVAETTSTDRRFTGDDWELSRKADRAVLLCCNLCRKTCSTGGSFQSSTDLAMDRGPTENHSDGPSRGHPIGVAPKERKEISIRAPREKVDKVMEAVRTRCTNDAKDGEADQNEGDKVPSSMQRTQTRRRSGGLDHGYRSVTRLPLRSGKCRHRVRISWRLDQRSSGQKHHQFSGARRIFKGGTQGLPARPGAV